ncbi:hypothetical protein V3470_14635 [Flavobacterium oreochromis]|uniref:Fibronectin type-III domain-containing protein n=2 Tax=Flavobacterium oreochromis TaxID=2906078 RepID=A0ABW8P9B3_9FLAO|nr:hypothetical protein [Flavobacterium oreochromis]OWP75233.1 hypothetical protein BWG23_11495 [Flavobacterium oreochromis]
MNKTIMNNQIKKNYILFSILFITITTFGQGDTTYVKPAVMAKGKIKEGKILLKWNVNDPYFWKKSLKSGYKLQRTTVLRNGEPINKDEVITLKEVLKPLPLKEWEPLVKQDSLTAVLAQAIYGEDFETTQNEKGIAKMMLLNDQNQQRYGFSLMASEQSYLATKAAGWGYEDTTAKPNEKYVYTITLLGQKAEEVNHGTVYIGLADKIDTTPPIIPEAIFGNQTVMLFWDFVSQKELYSCYNIERSTDGKNFIKLNETPIFPTLNKSSSYTTFTDKLPENNIKYYYRIIGIDTFGDFSTPSKVISGIGVDFLEYSPQITAKAALDDETVNLEWDFPAEGENKINGFNILQADTESGDFQLVKKELSPVTRKIIFKAKLKPSNYFKVQAVAKKGGYKESYPMLVQPIDSIPPTPPIGIQGTIDTLGIVKLRWKPNTESDFMGYKVFRSYAQDGQYVELTNKIIINNSFQDSINMKALNKKYFYRLKALDIRYNESKLSDFFIITKKDNIAPSIPVLSDYKIAEKKITIHFLQSESEDVKKHTLYRRKENEQEWKIIYETTNPKDTNYTDTQVDGKSKYYYAMTATDEDGNETEPSDALILESLPQLIRPAINSFSVMVDKTSRAIELYWNSKDQDIVEYQLYKRTKEKQNVLYKIFPSAKKNQFIDTSLNIGNIYYYNLRALYKDGSMSAFKEVKAEF